MPRTSPSICSHSARPAVVETILCWASNSTTPCSMFSRIDLEIGRRAGGLALVPAQLGQVVADADIAFEGAVLGELRRAADHHRPRGAGGVDDRGLEVAERPAVRQIVEMGLPRRRVVVVGARHARCGACRSARIPEGQAASCRRSDTKVNRRSGPISHHQSDAMPARSENLFAVMNHPTAARPSRPGCVALPSRGSILQGRGRFSSRAIRSKVDGYGFRCRGPTGTPPRLQMALATSHTTFGDLARDELAIEVTCSNCGHRRTIDGNAPGCATGASPAPASAAISAARWACPASASSAAGPAAWPSMRASCDSVLLAGHARAPLCCSPCSRLLAWAAPSSGQTTQDWITGAPREAMPIKAWPDGKKVAVCFVLYVEVWGRGQGRMFRPDMAAHAIPTCLNESFRQYAIQWECRGSAGCSRNRTCRSASRSTPSSRAASGDLEDSSGLGAQGVRSWPTASTTRPRMLPLDKGLDAQKAYIKRVLDLIEKRYRRPLSRLVEPQRHAQRRHLRRHRRRGHPLLARRHGLRCAVAAR